MTNTYVFQTKEPNMILESQKHNLKFQLNAKKQAKNCFKFVYYLANEYAAAKMVVGQ